MARVGRHGVLHRPVIHQVQAGQQAGARRAAGHGGGDVVAEGHAFPAEPVQVRRAQEIRSERRDEVGSPLIHDDEQHVAPLGHASLSRSNFPGRGLTGVRGRAVTVRLQRGDGSGRGLAPLPFILGHPSSAMPSAAGSPRAFSPLPRSKPISRSTEGALLNCTSAYGWPARPPPSASGGSRPSRPPARKWSQRIARSHNGHSTRRRPLRGCDPRRHHWGGGPAPESCWSQGSGRNRDRPYGDVSPS